MHVAPRARVLVVDDERENLELLERALRGYDVRAFRDPELALQALAREDVQIIISDQRMPGLTGVELLQRAAQVAPQAERILVSAYADFDVLREAINSARIQHFLPKPLDPQAVVSLVRRLLGDRELRRPAVLVTEPGLLAPYELSCLLEAGLEVSEGPETSRDPDVLLVPLEQLGRWERRWPEAVVLVLAPAARIEAALALATAGNVHDVLLVPFRREELLFRVRRACEKKRLALEVERLRRQRLDSYRYGHLLGRSPAMRALFEQIDRVGPTDATVLIQGETGTGKELVARTIHSVSPRASGPFVAVNCAALPDSLVEAELFGHEKGAFTGAIQRRAGRFEVALGGTLFIDELSEIPLSTQVKLLRVIQERTLERVGGSTPVPVDVRLVAASNKDLREEVDKGRFREDLYYRLRVVPLALPPLRERKEDIALLAGYFLEQVQRRLHRTDLKLSPEALRALEAHSWPGNVRELENAIERAAALAQPGAVLQPADLLPEQLVRPIVPMSLTRPGADAAPRPLKDVLTEIELLLIRQALDRHHGNQSRAARDLGITRQGLAQKIAKYGITRYAMHADDRS